jgi:hypothetical protein
MSDQPDHHARALFERLLIEIVGARADMNVLTAVVMRLDGSHAALLTEIRALHASQSRLADRVRALAPPL